jgi:hypothetical protein
MIVTEYPLPTVTVGPYANLCNTDAFFTMTGGSPAGGTYSGPGVIGGIFSPATAGVGTHAITYEFTDANGCFNSSTANITIDDCSGINELDDIGLILYPNPVSTLFTIKTEGAIINDVNIYDAAGRLVKTFSIESSNTTLDVSNYATGLYTVEVRVEDKFYRKRITKQ